MRYIHLKAIILSFISLVISVSVYSQSQADILAYLRKNITISYLAIPNTKDPDIKPIKTSAVIDAEKGIIFGATDNNGMDVDAKLLIALLKDQDKTASASALKDRDGDPDFQKAVYQAMQISKKKIELLIINDAHDAIDKAFMGNYNFFVMDFGAKTYVYPGAYSTDATGYAGAIALGSVANTNLKYLKEMFIGLVVQTGIKDFGTVKPLRSIKFDLKGYKGVTPFYFATYDHKRLANQAIANAFMYNYSKELRTEFESWDKGGEFSFQPVRGTKLSTLSDELPERESIQYVFKQIDSKNNGCDKAKYPGGVPDEILKTWVFNAEECFETASGDLSTTFKYRMLSDAFLGHLFYHYIRVAGISKFIEAIRMNSDRFIKTVPHQKVSVLFQNLSLIMLGTKTLADINKDPALKEGHQAAFAVALFDYFGLGDIHVVQDNKTAFTATQFHTAFLSRTYGSGTDPEGNFRSIIEYYKTNWQKKVGQYLLDQTITPYPGITFFEKRVNNLADGLGAR